MNVVERAKGVCLSPDLAWAVIANERAGASGLIAGYVLPLAGTAAVAQVIGESVVGRSLGLFGTYRTPLGTGIGLALASLVFAAVGVVLMSLVIDALAPTFGVAKNREQALKLAVYSATPVWVAGVLQILPALGIVVLLGALYSLYLLYLGLPRLMKCPPEKTVSYTGAVIACAVVMALAGSALIARIPGVEATASLP